MGSKKFGFTMLELLMVMVIISTLGTSAIGTFMDFRTEARIAHLQ